MVLYAAYIQRLVYFRNLTQRLSRKKPDGRAAAALNSFEKNVEISRRGFNRPDALLVRRKAIVQMPLRFNAHHSLLAGGTAFQNSPQGMNQFLSAGAFFLRIQV